MKRMVGERPIPLLLQLLLLLLRVFLLFLLFSSLPCTVADSS